MKRAKNCTREELVAIVDRVQVAMYAVCDISEEALWNPMFEYDDNDVMSDIDDAMRDHGLRPTEIEPLKETK